MEQLLGIPISTWGAGGLLGMTVLMIIHGNLIPKRWHDKALLELTEERNFWRRMALEQTDQKRLLLEERSLGTTVLETIRDTVSGDGDA